MIRKRLSSIDVITLDKWIENVTTFGLINKVKSYALSIDEQ